MNDYFTLLIQATYYQVRKSSVVNGGEYCKLVEPTRSRLGHENLLKAALLHSDALKVRCNEAAAAD